MVQVNDINSQSTSVATVSSTNTPKLEIGDRPAPPDDTTSGTPTETVAAVTIAVLAVVIVLTMVLVFRALRKRQRARQGEQFGENTIPTITTGVMGTGGSAYVNSQNAIPVRGQIRWESINPSSGTDTSSHSTQR